MLPLNSEVVGDTFILCLSLKPLLSAPKVSLSAWQSSSLVFKQFPSPLDTTSKLQFNNKIYARAPSCRDLVPPEITFTPAMAMSSSSFGGLPPSAPAMDENVYEELQRRRAVEEWRRPPHPGSDIGLERRGETQEEEEGEGYDHLDFARSQELKPHYHSTDTLRSSPQSAQSRHSSGGSRDFTSEVLTSVENLKTSTRKTIYEPETDSGVSSSQNTMTSLQAVQNTTTTAIL